MCSECYSSAIRVSVFCLQSSVYFPLHFVNTYALSKPRTCTTALAFVVPQNCFCRIRFLKGNMTAQISVPRVCTLVFFHWTSICIFIQVKGCGNGRGGRVRVEGRDSDEWMAIYLDQRKQYTIFLFLVLCACLLYVEHTYKFVF